MRIAIDATQVLPQGKGIARYQKNLALELTRLPSEHEYVIFHRRSVFEAPPAGQGRCEWVPVPFFIALIWEQIQLPWYLKKYKIDLAHCTQDTLPIMTGVPFVSYIFETPFFRNRLARRGKIKQQLRARIYERLSSLYHEILFPYSVRKASRIITSSKFTKSELAENYGIALDRIEIIPPAPERTFRPADTEFQRIALRQQLTGGVKFILHFATGDPRENSLTAFHAFKRLKEKFRGDVKLVIIGSREPRDSEIHRLLLENHLSDSVIWKGYVDESTLVSLYQAASAYLDPSLYEGFGYQPLEAMTCGAPVITSNRTSVPEIVGEAGILIDPMDVEAYAQALNRILSDDSEEQEFRRRSLVQSAKFNWDQVSERILECFQKAQTR